MNEPMDDFDFISNVKALSDNGTLRQVLDMIEDDFTKAWKSAKPADLQLREDNFRMIRAVTALRDKIHSLSTDDKVRQFNNRRMLRQTNG